MQTPSNLDAIKEDEEDNSFEKPMEAQPNDADPSNPSKESENPSNNPQPPEQNGLLDDEYITPDGQLNNLQADQDNVLDFDKALAQQKEKLEQEQALKD